MIRPAIRAASVLALAIFVGVVGLARPLTILYTNDLHLRYSRLDSLRELIEAERTEGGPILLLDGGDALQDFRRPLTAVWGGDEMVGWMNDIGYDAMALGNHELYWGSDRLDQLAALASFPILCANLIAASGYTPPFVPSAVRVVDGIRVLLVGVVTSFHLPYPDFPWLRYAEPAGAVAREVDRLGESVDLIAVVGHVPVIEAARIAREVPSIDVFVSGHSHEETPEPVRVGKTLIVQSGAFAHALGRLTVDVTDEGATLVSNDLLPTESAPADVGRGLLRFLTVACAVLATALLVLL